MLSLHLGYRCSAFIRLGDRSYTGGTGVVLSLDWGIGAVLSLDVVGGQVQCFH